MCVCLLPVWSDHQHGNRWISRDTATASSGVTSVDGQKCLVQATPPRAQEAAISLEAAHTIGSQRALVTASDSLAAQRGSGGPRTTDSSRATATQGGRAASATEDRLRGETAITVVVVAAAPSE